MTDPDNRGLRTLAEKILAAPTLSREQRKFWRQPIRDLQSLIGRDYRQALRHNVRRSEVQALIASARDFWPEVNRVKLPLPTSADLVSISKRLALNLSTRACRKRDGMALRGFYMRSIDEVSKDHRKGGLIYLNTAHHPAAVGATFCHEIGHHLALKILPHRDERPVNFFFDAAYSSHLDDPVELTADILVAVAAYPKPSARKIFGIEAATKDDLGADLRPILTYLKSEWDVDLQGRRQPRHHLIYLVGMVHYAKLRKALLTEYRI